MTDQAVATAGWDTAAGPVDVLAELMRPEVLYDPYPFYRWLREELPVHRHRSGSYVLTRHADVLWMFQSPQLRAPEQADLAASFPRLVPHRSFQMLTGTLAVANPPRHTRLRRLISRNFTTTMVAGLQPKIQAACDELLAGLAGPLRGGEVVDLHAGLSRPLSQLVIADLIGLDPADRPALTPLVTSMMHATNPAATEAMLVEADHATEELSEYYRGLIGRRRAEPREDMISALAAVQDDDAQRLTEDELMSWLWGLWLAGFETSANGLDSGTLIMMGHPDQTNWLHEGPAEVTAYVNECLRYEPPNMLTGVPRTATEDIEVSGTVIVAGADVRALPGCANRDPLAFDDPDRFDPSRDTSATVTFGHGIHYCLGAQLARTIMGTALPRLNTMFPTLTAAEPPVRRRALPLRAFDRLGVALDGSRG
jgi:cytochrome P450